LGDIVVVVRQNNPCFTMRVMSSKHRNEQNSSKNFFRLRIFYNPQCLNKTTQCHYTPVQSGFQWFCLYNARYRQNTEMDKTIIAPINKTPADFTPGFCSFERYGALVAGNNNHSFATHYAPCKRRVDFRPKSGIL